jgi:hypothetical protein
MSLLLAKAKKSPLTTYAAKASKAPALLALKALIGVRGKTVSDWTM